MELVTLPLPNEIVAARAAEGRAAALLAAAPELAGAALPAADDAAAELAGAELAAGAALLGRADVAEEEGAASPPQACRRADIAVTPVRASPALKNPRRPMLNEVVWLVLFMAYTPVLLSKSPWHRCRHIEKTASLYTSAKCTRTTCGLPVRVPAPVASQRSSEDAGGTQASFVYTPSAAVRKLENMTFAG